LLIEYLFLSLQRIFQNRGQIGPLFCYKCQTMITTGTIKQHLEEILPEKELFLVDVAVRPGNKIVVHVDSMKGVTLDECIFISRFLEGKFDREKEDFELEVSSPGLDKPLKLLFQYKKNLGRQLDVVKTDGIKITGKLTAVQDDAITLEVNQVVKDAKTKKKKTEIHNIEISFQDIKTAKIVISLK
jgi:ribosome maturation factor RimP